MASSETSPLDLDVQLAASAGIASLHNLLSCFSNPPSSSSSSSSSSLTINPLLAFDDAVSHFQRLASLLSPNSSNSTSSRTCNSTGIGHARFRSSRNPTVSGPSFAPSFGSKRAFLAVSDESRESKGAAPDSRKRVGAMDIDLNGDPNLTKEENHGCCKEILSGSGPMVMADFPIRGTRPAKSARIEHDSKASSSLSAGSNLSFDLNTEAPSMECNSSDFSLPALKFQEAFGVSQAHSKEAKSSITADGPSASRKDQESSRTFHSHRPQQSQGNLVPAEEFTFSRKDDCNGGARLATDLSLSGGGESCIVNDEGSVTPKLGKSQKTLIFGHKCAEIQQEREVGAAIEAKQDLLRNGEKPWNYESSNGQTLSSCTTIDTATITASDASLVPSPSKSKVCRADSKSKCHCRSRKLKNKWITRVPAISDKIAEIPSDDHSWRKYGQKPIKGSPYPRGYYKCSGVKGCPAKKHVERALDDPTMLIVTYEGEHVHPQSSIPLATPMQCH